MPENVSIFKGLSYLSPSRVLSQMSKVPFAQLPLQHLMGEKVYEIEEQYRKIPYIDWQESEVFQSGTIPKDTVEFWSKVKDFKSVDDNFVFRDLANYCLACLSLPVSNSFVERVFSQVTFVKSKQRNRLSTKMLDSVIRIKSFLNSRHKCCRDLKVTQEMIKRFSADIYSESSTDTDSEQLDILTQLS